MAGLGVTINRKAVARNITVDTRKFFASVGKATIKLMTGAINDAASEIPEIVSAIGLTTSPEDRATSLVLGALERALASIIAPFVEDLDIDITDVHASRFTGLSQSFAIEIDTNFFTRPDNSNALSSIIPEAVAWMQAINISEVNARNLASRLSLVLARSLHDEWREKAEYYRVLLDKTDTPFVDAALFEQEWEHYRTFLASFRGEQVFDETFSLSQIYVVPRCYHTASATAKNDGLSFEVSAAHASETIRIVKVLGDEIDAWLASPNDEFTTRVIAGGPGAGKSSYAKLLSSQLAVDGRDVLFVPLHQIDLEAGIASAISQYFKESGHFSDNPLNRIGEGNVVTLILDGLDEIQMQGRAAQDAAYNMINDLLRWIDRVNSVSLRIKCVITGRELSVQSAEGLFKAEGQILHLLPYHVSQNDRNMYIDTAGLLEVDQRDEWWIRYGSLTGRGYDSIPQNLKEGEIGDVTAQPLLNYLVALAYERGLSIQEETNVNSVYEDLLKAVFDRSWAKNSHSSIRDVPYDSFVRLLEEVSLAVWHGAGRTTTLIEVEEHCKQSKVGPLLKSLGESSSSGISSLLLAFYFRQKGRRTSGEKTFEFTHKTFAEYLTALGIVRTIDTVTKQIEIFYNDPDLGIDEESGLHKWLILCGRTPFDNYLNEFVRREVRSRGKEKCVVWQAALVKLLSAATRTGWPIHRIEGITFTEQTRRVRNAEEALLACINACARVTNKQSEIQWVSENAFGAMIRRLQGQRVGPANVLAMSCLSYLKLDGQCLDIADLYNSDLSFSSLVGAECNYANMLLADLSGCDFTGAAMVGCNLSSAKVLQSKLPIYQLAELRDQRLAERIIDDEERLKPTRSYRSFLAFVRRFMKRGAILVDEKGGVIDEDNVEEFYNNRRRMYSPAGRRHLEDINRAKLQNLTD